MDDERPIRVHQPCPDCGSSDALAIYADHTYCFSCGQHTQTESTLTRTRKPVSYELPDLIYKSLPKRGLTEDTCKFYDTQVDIEKQEVYFHYHDENGNRVAFKKRDKDKKFSTGGMWKDTVPLFGMDRFQQGGKIVTICEGEFDPMAAYQMTGSRWPFVSVKNGATGALKDCKAAYEWLNSFETIVICFDADEPGRKAAQEVAELFAGKSKIVKHVGEFKDANDYLMADQTKAFIDAFWRAEPFALDGIINGSSLYDEVMSPVGKPDALYPWKGLNRLAYGIRHSELVTLTAGSGLGKSQVLRELVYHLLNTTKEQIGMLFLEEGKKKTGLGIMSLAANKPLHVPDLAWILGETTEFTESVTKEEKQEAYDKTLGTGRLWLFNHFGSTEIDNVVARLRYMIKVCGCRYAFLDHITIVVSSQENGDERKALDEVMTKLRMLVEETGVCLFLVSHLKRPTGAGHEEGAATSLAQLRGSGAIGQLSDMVIGLERNGQAEDPIERNTTQVRVLKNRPFGLTGKACQLLYDHDTGRLSELGEDL